MGKKAKRNNWLTRYYNWLRSEMRNVRRSKKQVKINYSYIEQSKLAHDRLFYEHIYR